MDTTLTVGGGTTLGAAETATPEQSTDTGNAAPETTSTETSGEQSTAEGSGQEASQGRKRWSIQDEVKELRAQRRELREQLSQFGSVRDELASLREELNRRNQPPGQKTPANFWQDPEGTIAEKLQAMRDDLRESITSEFHTTREQEFQQQALNQERAQALEFIRSQKGYDASDEDILADIIMDLPERMRLNASPMYLAEYAWMKLNSQRGVGDRSLAKQRASGVQGQPPGTGFGRKIWNKAEYEDALNQIEKTPTDPKWNDLIKELEAAHKENRVR
jgi:hypothetical protein